MNEVPNNDVPVIIVQQVLGWWFSYLESEEPILTEENFESCCGFGPDEDKALFSLLQKKEISDDTRIRVKFVSEEDEDEGDSNG